MPGVLRRGKKRRRLREGHWEDEAELGAMQPQAKGYRLLERQEGPSRGYLRGAQPC